MRGPPAWHKTCPSRCDGRIEGRRDVLSFVGFGSELRGVAVVRRERVRIVCVIVSIFTVGYLSSIIAFAAMTQASSVDPFDTSTSRYRFAGRVTAGADVHSAPQWAGDLEKQQGRVGSNSRPMLPPNLDKTRQVLDSPKASRVLARCRVLGMRELPELAFAMSEPGGGSRSGYFIVPMANPKGNRFASAMLYREGDGNVIAITVDTATNELTDVILPESEPGADEEVIRFNKKKWVECFMSACGPCIAGCTFTGPLWLKCTGACCGVAAVVCVYIAMQE